VTACSDLTCAELVELVTDYLEGALTASDRARFEEHVVACDACTTHVEQMRSTIAVLGRLTEDDVAREPAEELLAAFRGWKRAAAKT
jgi:anti-sigma factor RsiW